MRLSFALFAARAAVTVTRTPSVVGEGQFRDSTAASRLLTTRTGGRVISTFTVPGLESRWRPWLCRSATMACVPLGGTGRSTSRALTREEYLQSRMVSTPFGLYDCDIPVHGCGAYVITTADRAVDLPHPPAYVLGTAAPYFAMHENTITRGHTLERHEECGRIVAHDLWEDSALKASDIDVANLYDGFSFIVMLWLEALGFLRPRRVVRLHTGRKYRSWRGSAAQPGRRQSRHGRLHGVNHATESVLQVMNRAGVRQAERADRVLFSVGPPARGAALILGREPQEQRP